MRKEHRRVGEVNNAFNYGQLFKLRVLEVLEVQTQGPRGSNKGFSEVQTEKEAVGMESQGA